ncbi:MAG: polysaccharide deacetylase family protein [Verrucomicrobiaceae bacterium]|nr:polysaccharide deacetylase family protein [Verrucomicrobiaceae bacterium]
MTKSASTFALAFAFCSAAACAQTTAPAPVPPAEVPDVIVRKAIPIGEPSPMKTDALPRVLPADAKRVYSQCVVESNVIAITFDDGPDPKGTPRLLDMLKERGIKATFFLVGKCAATWPDIVKRMHDEGHEIGNHTWNHLQLTRLKDTKVMSELQTTHDAIFKACGFAPTLYRPPYGATRLAQQKSIHDQFTYTCILWDVDPNDWRSPRSSTKVHDRVLAQTKPGSIILCHDIHHETVDAMPSTLDDLKARGFQFVTVSQLINLESRTLAERAAFVAAAKAADAPAAAPSPAPVSASGATPAAPGAPAPAASPQHASSAAIAH